MRADWGKTSLALAIFLLVLGGCWFTWKVFYYAGRIKAEGAVSFEQIYSHSAATADNLRALAQGAPGTGVVGGLPGSEPFTGPAEAKLTVVQFADYGCPYSSEVSLVTRALEQLHREDVKFIYRNFPLEDLHEGATNAALAAECAHLQGKFSLFHELLYRLKGDLTSESLLATAESAGLNIPLWERCMGSAEARQALETDIADGLAAGVTSTPTFFFNGVKIEGAIPYAIFNSLLSAFN